MHFINSSSIFIKFIYLIFSLFLFLFIYSSSYLRPAADDYCFGYNSSFGIIGGVYQWWQTWSGFVLTNFIGNLTVGLPLIYFDWPFTSSFTFIVTSFSLSFSILFILNNYFYKFLNFYLFFIIFLFSWTFYISSPLFISFKFHESYDLSEGILHWQTLNGTYILQFILIISSIIAINLSIFRNNKNYLFILLLFFLSGTSGSSVSLSILILIIIYFIYSKLTNQKTFIFTNKNLFLAFLACLSGFIFSHLSPGNLIRHTAINPNFNISIFNYLIILLKSIFFTLKYLFFQTFNFSTFLTLLFLIFSFLLFLPSKISYKINNNIILNYILFFISISIVSAFVSFFLGYFAYNAYWHRTTSHVSYFYFLIFISLWFSFHLKFYFKSFNFSVLNKIYILFIFIFYIIFIFTFSTINVRHKFWNEGPAPLGKVTDIEGEWQRICWDNLNSVRDSKLLR